MALIVSSRESYDVASVSSTASYVPPSQKFELAVPVCSNDPLAKLICVLEILHLKLGCCWTHVGKCCIANAAIFRMVFAEDARWATIAMRRPGMNRHIHRNRSTQKVEEPTCRALRTMMRALDCFLAHWAYINSCAGLSVRGSTLDPCFSTGSCAWILTHSCAKTLKSALHEFR